MLAQIKKNKVITYEANVRYSDQEKKAIARRLAQMNAKPETVKPSTKTLAEINDDLFG
jgi:hypothetical protein